MKTVVLYHANCPDGFCAAWVAKKSLPSDTEFIPVQYGQEPPDICDKIVYLLDFSYKRDVMSQVIGQAYAVCVLDHHKTAQAELDFPSCSSSKESWRRGDGKVHIQFDMDKSGGRLAWEHFFPGKPSPWLVDYTEDRDLWRFKLPHSREISAFIRSHPFDFDLWNSWNNYDNKGKMWMAHITEGQAILRYQQQLVDQAALNAVESVMDGYKIKVVNTTVCFSEVAGELAKGRPFGAVYFIRGDGKKQWSLRSTDEGIDVAELAKRHGGGGHRNAAGFEE